MFFVRYAPPFAFRVFSLYLKSLPRLALPSMRSGLALHDVGASLSFDINTLINSFSLAFISYYSPSIWIFLV